MASSSPYRQARCTCARLTAARNRLHLKVEQEIFYVLRRYPRTGQRLKYLEAEELPPDYFPRRQKRFLGMTPAQRFVISVMLLMMACMVGGLILLVGEKFYSLLVKLFTRRSPSCREQPRRCAPARPRYLLPPAPLTAPPARPRPSGESLDAHAQHLPVGGDQRQVVGVLHHARRGDPPDLVQRFLIDGDHAAGGAALAGYSSSGVRLPKPCSVTTSSAPPGSTTSMLATWSPLSRRMPVTPPAWRPMGRTSSSRSAAPGPAR